tara:strand:- start:9327 stop:10808 length:1482 start_codon:yes stop_codon:yes gene_type:complete
MKRILLFFTIYLTGCVSQINLEPSAFEDSSLDQEVTNQSQALIIEVDLWQRIRSQLSFKIPDGYTPAQKFRDKLIGNQHSVNRISKSGQRYLFYTVSKAEELGLPIELALLPFVESEFDPYARSVDGATGIWQFIPSTGRQYGLKSNWWYDGKRDVIASTDAALEYLTVLSARFNNDWLLAMAAYNAGPTRVRRAINKNKLQGKNTDFWSLNLPLETTAYIPKLLVLSELINNPVSYGVTLPSIPNRPYFLKVEIPGQMDLMQAADLAGMNPESIYELNPGFSQWATDPSGPHYLLLPTGIADRFALQLESIDKSELVKWDRYRILRGDNLTKIARNYSMEVSVLKEINQLTNDLIITGKEIMVPRGPAWTKTFIPKSKKHLVAKGDSLWAISKKFDVSIKDISIWNDLKLNKPLQIGQVIKIFSQYERVRGQTPPKKTQTLLYPIKSGDTLSRIASKFSVRSSDIQKWNNIKDEEVIFPGQVLKLLIESGAK